MFHGPYSTDHPRAPSSLTSIAENGPFQSTQSLRVTDFSSTKIIPSGAPSISYLIHTQPESNNRTEFYPFHFEKVRPNSILNASTESTHSDHTTSCCPDSDRSCSKRTETHTSDPQAVKRSDPSQSTSSIEKSNESKQNIVKSSNSTLLCTLCSRTFPSKQTLLGHLRIHRKYHGSKIFKCTYCNEVFPLVFSFSITYYSRILWPMSHVGLECGQ